MARSGFTGATKAEGTARLAVAARWAQRIPLPQQLSRPDDPTVELVTFDDGAIRGEHFFADDATLPDPYYTVRVGAAEVTVTAGALLRDLALFPDRIHPESTVDDMPVTLLPGESETFRLTGLDPAADYTAPPILRCANDLDSKA